MKKKLIVFDIDDTLTKSEFQHQHAYVETMKFFGIKDIDQNWKSYQHHTDSHILKVNYENNLNSKFDFSFIEEFEVKMTEEILKLKPTIEIKGAQNMMNFVVNETDYGVCFATGSILQPAFIKLNQAGVEHKEELVVASNLIFEREGIVQQAIEQAKKYYQVQHFEEIISFGDGIWDLKTARNLNIHFVGVGEKNLEDFRSENISSHIVDWSEFDLDKIELELGINSNRRAL